MYNELEKRNLILGGSYLYCERGILHWGYCGVHGMNARYKVKLRKLKSGVNGSTQYSYSTKVKAVAFAAGYQAALHDTGRTDCYVSVWDSGNPIQPRGHKCELIFDTEELTKIAQREF